LPRLIVGRCSCWIGAGAAAAAAARADGAVVAAPPAAAAAVATAAAVAPSAPETHDLRWHGDSFQLVSSLFQSLSRASCSFVMGAGGGRSMSFIFISF